MTAQDVERIARAALRELGAGDVPLSIAPEAGTDRWRINVGGPEEISLHIRAGGGTSAQFVRDQIFEQFQRH